MSTYKVRYERDEGGWWLARVAGVAGCHSQGRSISQARRRVREALGLFVEDAETATLLDEVVLPAEIRRQQRRWRAIDEKARALDAAAATAFCTLVVRLVDEAGWSLRDVSEVTRLTHQRIHQIVADKGRCGRQQAHGRRGVGG